MSPTKRATRSRSSTPTTWAVTETIKVGQRPRGIEFTPRRQVRDGRGRRRRHHPGDRHQNPAGGGHPALRSRSRAVHPGCRRQDRSMSPTRTTTRSPIIDHREAHTARRHPGRRRARRHDGQPGRQDPDLHLRDHQHGAFHRHRDAPDRRQCAGRCAAALCRVQARRIRAVGLLRDRRHGLDHRSGQARGHRQGQLRHSRPAQRGDPAGRHRHHQGRQDGLRRARSGQPRRRGRRRDPSR